MDHVVTLAVFFAVFLLSTTLHEAGHAWAAMRGGDLTAYRGGQVSLDPIPHMRREPFGMLVLPILGLVTAGWPFGFASAPYDPQWALRYPTRSALMSLAGPAANLLLAVTAGLLLRLGAMAGVFSPPTSVEFARMAEGSGSDLAPGAVFILSVCFSMNVLLFAFNLIPLPPLDGSGALPLLMNERTAEKYLMLLFTNPALGWIGMFGAWRLFGRVAWPVLLFAANALWPGAHYS